MENRRLATIQVNETASGFDWGIVCDDISHWVALPGGGTVIYFRDGKSPLKISESVTDVQTAVNALWDESHT